MGDSPAEDSRQESRRLDRDHPTKILQSSAPDGRAPIGSHCRAGHDQPNNPTWHRSLGLVPALTSVIFGAVLVLVIIGIEAWLLPTMIGWTIALLLVGLLLSAVIQLALGHRGWCWLWRTLRWWMGPIGTIIDPIEMG